MSSAQKSSGVYVIINNIPKNYSSDQLRNFFSSFVEAGGFICFHYIHRPEVQKLINSSDGGEKRKSDSSCCVVKVVADRVHELIATYNGQHWSHKNGKTLPTRCFIKEIKLSDNGKSIHGGCRYAIPKNLPFDREEFSVQEVESLREMRPQSFMPNGNVGTTTDYLLNEIRLNKLPPRVIQKLGLLSNNSQASGISSNVASDCKAKKKGKKKSKGKISNSKAAIFPNIYFHSPLPGKISNCEDGDYKEILCPEVSEGGQYQALHHLHGQGTLFEGKNGLKSTEGGSGLVSNPYVQCSNDSRWAIPGLLPTPQLQDSAECGKSLLGMPPPFFMPNANTLCPQVAEWHQYQALCHLYGPGTLLGGKNGLKWTEGGPGLVSNPYGQCWNGVGNRDTRDVEKMRLEEKDGNDTEVDSVQTHEFAGFEKYNKGIGSKILKSLGWKEGEGIGKNRDGIAEPLPNEGQCNKKGFGYQCAKSNYRPSGKKRSGLLGDGKESGPQDSVLASTSDDKSKYQKEFLKGTL